MNHSTAAQHPWEEWQLTAFVLGELEPALAEAIRVAASSDSALAAEIESIRGALAQVTQVLKDESQITPALTPSGAAGWQRVLQSAHRATVESDSMWPAAPRRQSVRFSIVARRFAAVPTCTTPALLPQLFEPMREAHP